MLVWPFRESVSSARAHVYENRRLTLPVHASTHSSLLLVLSIALYVAMCCLVLLVDCVFYLAVQDHTLRGYWS